MRVAAPLRDLPPLAEHPFLSWLTWAIGVTSRPRSEGLSPALAPSIGPAPLSRDERGVAGMASLFPFANLLAATSPPPLTPECDRIPPAHDAGRTCKSLILKKLQAGPNPRRVVGAFGRHLSRLYRVTGGPDRGTPELLSRDAGAGWGLGLDALTALSRQEVQTCEFAGEMPALGSPVLATHGTGSRIG